MLRKRNFKKELFEFLVCGEWESVITVKLLRAPGFI